MQSSQARTPENQSYNCLPEGKGLGYLSDNEYSSRASEALGESVALISVRGVRSLSSLRRVIRKRQIIIFLCRCN